MRFFIHHQNTHNPSLSAQTLSLARLKWGSRSIFLKHLSSLYTLTYLLTYLLISTCTLHSGSADISLECCFFFSIDSDIIRWTRFHQVTNRRNKTKYRQLSFDSLLTLIWDVIIKKWRSQWKWAIFKVYSVWASSRLLSTWNVILSLLFVM